MKGMVINKYSNLRWVLVFTLFLSIVTSYAQNVDIRFKRDSVNCALRSVCYSTQIKPNGTIPINFAGQNFRIFYNGALAKTTSVTSLMPSGYSFKVVTDTIVDASIVDGPLSFEPALGFLNYYLDLGDLQNGGVEIPLGEWYSTTRVCFEVEPEVFSDPNTCLEAVWGREGLTDNYATAFNEISRWISKNKTTSVNIINYTDLNSASGDEACFTQTCSQVKSNISVGDVFSLENNSSVTLQVCIAEAASSDVSVTVMTSDNTAKAGEDYVALPATTVVIPAGQTCTPVTISLLNDIVYEGDETFHLILSNPSDNAVIAKDTAIITIADDEQVPELSIQDLTVNENDNTVTLSVVLSGKINSAVSFKVNSLDGTAKAGEDYTSIINQIYTIPALDTIVNISLNILNDDVSEPTETMSIVLSDVSSNVVLKKGTGIVTILDDEVIPTMSVQDIVVHENAGIIHIAANLSGKSSKATSFTVSTADITALAAIDYEQIYEQSYTIPAGQISINIPVSIIDDLFFEPTKTFELTLKNISNNVLVNKTTAVITILDDDVTCNAKAPKLSKL